MITERDLVEAIAECQGERNPNANTCRNLAAFYVILDHIKKSESVEEKIIEPIYSYSNNMDNSVQVLGESDFLKRIYGKNIEDVLYTIDELMETLQVINPRLYDGVMRKL